MNWDTITRPRFDSQNKFYTFRQMKIKATVEGLDDWSRLVIVTERGTRLCDTNCHNEDVLRENPALGHWHTMTADWGEPIAAIKPEVEIEIV